MSLITRRRIGCRVRGSTIPTSPPNEVPTQSIYFGPKSSDDLKFDVVGLMIDFSM